MLVPAFLRAHGTAGCLSPAEARAQTIRRLCVYGFFGLFLLLGLGVYADYGISWDEEVSRANGMVTLRYLAELVSPGRAAHHADGTYPPLHEWSVREYGVFFETPACLLERLLGIDDVGDRYRLRHLLTFLVGYGGAVALYQLARRRFADWRLGLLAATWLVLSPRLFAESFYNSKDAVFMALFAIALNTGVRLFRQPSAGRAFWHALACAAAIDVRIMALMLPLATLGMLLLRTLGGELAWRRVLPLAALYLGLLGVFVVAFWPYLWPAPLENLRSTFSHMNTNIYWDNTILYQGQAIRASQVPWHYISGWILVTTPLLYLAVLALGLAANLRLLLPRWWRRWAADANAQDLFFSALLLLPLLGVVLLRSVLYDGWRHLYFVYPALLLVALRGWVLAWRGLSAPGWPRLAPTALLAFTGLGMAGTAIQMVQAHPHQHVYFNLLAGPDVETRYELDYWGLSFRPALAYIAAHDARPHIKVLASSPVARVNLKMLPPADQRRIILTESEPEADYFITNYRWHPQPYPYPREVHRVMAGPVRIHSVFKLK